ncbi:class I SAM-dependent methyltransferase [Roseibium sp.]|uniref:class I SAM-dependent methyltransferase n=1 Tax=Roseibium sp. TaxID=1936156 RepID=UPI003D14A269
MFGELQEIYKRPDPFSVYTAEELWTNEHRSKNMLRFHLDGAIDVSSRNSGFLEQSSRWIANHFNLRKGKSVCDFGCGPGLYTSRFARSGAQVTGIDFSLNSIRHARAQAQHTGTPINYMHGNYLDFRTDEQFDLITMIMCDYCALSPAQRQQLLTIWRDSLANSGAVLLDVYSMTAYRGRKEAKFCEKNQLGHFWHTDDYYAFVNTFKYDDEAVILDKYSIFPEHSKAETVYNWLQYFSPESLADEVSGAGLKLEQIFGNVAGTEFCDRDDEFAVVLTK